MADKTGPGALNVSGNDNARHKERAEGRLRESCC